MKSIQRKFSIVVLLFLSASSAVGIISYLLLESILPALLISLAVIFLLSYFFSIAVRILVLNRIFQIEKEIDIVGSGQSDHRFPVNSNDEFDRLADRMNRMLASIDGRISRGIKQVTDEITIQENSKYLQNIHDGLLFIDYGQIISDDYSRSLADIFDREEIGGQHLSDFLYPDREVFREKRKSIETFLKGLFTDPGSFDSISDENNPLHNIWISRDDGKRILVDGVFRKVEEKGELVQILIIFKDRTDEGLLEKKLDEKDLRSNFELETIVAILRAGPGPFLQFIEESYVLLAELREEIAEIRNEEVIRKSFRTVHSMKCSAAYFDFQAVEKLCHNLEEILSDFRKGNFSRKQALDIIVDDIYAQFDHIKHLVNKFREFLLTEEGRVYEMHKNEQDHFFDSLRIMLSRHADYLEKDIHFSFDSDFENFPLIEKIKTPVIHLLRNAVDHGIEFPEEREGCGKNGEGEISLSIKEREDKSVKITIEDDGQGIDFNKIREIAVARGFIKKEESPGRENLIRTLFLSGFSSRDGISGLSGRGIGLDAVKEDVNRIGGKISVKTEPAGGTRMTILLPPDLF